MINRILGLLLGMIFCAAGGIALAGDNQPFTWKWDPQKTHVTYSVLQVDENYVIDLSSKPDPVFRTDLKIQVSQIDGRVVWSWLGHAYSVFLIKSDRLYYVDFNTASTGGNIIAVDLKTGLQIWDHELYALGGPGHSKYRNLVNMEIRSDSVVVYGDEAFGKYIEVVDKENGKLIHHQFIKDPEHPFVKTAPTTSPASQPVVPDDATLRNIAMEYLQNRRSKWISEIENMPGKVSDAGDLWVYTFQGSGAKAGNYPEVYVDKSTMNAVYPLY